MNPDPGLFDELNYFNAAAERYRFNTYVIAFHTEEIAALLEVFAATGDEDVEAKMDMHAQALTVLAEQQDQLTTLLDQDKAVAH